ncbi:MAG TPA: CvpA family protein [Candidatus Paceibacterota bacterium]|nr:CvpA family protein [Verrucomicrobiota bacterium]HRZ47047.1 CvpA family protein [Candidatus Paceibacterota bacterium]HRZ93690.1 CvpA family protein [Candidatus Paceibacterota bacterium]
MTFWIAGLLLCSLFAVAGYFLGAVRALVGLAGLILGAVLALPLAPYVKPLFPYIKITHPVWLWFWPPVLVLLLIEIVALVLGFVAQWRIDLYQRFKFDDVERLRWRRLNQRLGAGVGVAIGTVYLVLFGLFIYVPGYFTLQVAKDDADPGWLRFVNRARLDLQSTGLDRIVAPFDPAPKLYYEVADILGLMHKNMPNILTRMRDYPPFMTLGERQEFQDMAGDKDYMKLLRDRAGLAGVMPQERTIGFITNEPLIQELLQLDLKDVRAYLETGKSAKYDPIKLLGRWQMEPGEAIIMTRKSRTNINARELRALKTQMIAMAKGTRLKATHDGRVSLTIQKMVSNPASVALAQPAGIPPQLQAQAATGRLGAPSGMSAEMRRRYGLGAAEAPASAPGQPQAALQAEPVQFETVEYSGTWDGEGSNYRFQLSSKNQKISPAASIDSGFLIVNMPDQKLVFIRQF